MHPKDMATTLHVAAMHLSGSLRIGAEIYRLVAEENCDVRITKTSKGFHVFAANKENSVSADRESLHDAVVTVAGDF